MRWSGVKGGSGLGVGRGRKSICKPLDMRERNNNRWSLALFITDTKKKE